MVEEEIKYWEENEDEFSELINTEYWKKIEGWNYTVSTEGQVYSHKTNKFLKPSFTKIVDKYGCGYNKINLCQNNNKYYPTLHKLLARAFIPNPNNYSDVHHRDNNPFNNTIGNLMWMPHKDNCRGDNKKRGHIGSVEPFGDGYWRARFKYNYNEYSQTRKNKEIVETWLKNREYELINNLPLTDIEPEYNPKGSVSICKNSWRVRVTLKNGDRWSKSVKTEEIGIQLKDYIIEHVKNENIITKEDADEYYKIALN